MKHTNFFQLFSDHWFDSPNALRGRQGHKSAEVSVPDQPAHGERGVRPYHARMDNKVLAYKRGGHQTLPELMN